MSNPKWTREQQMAIDTRNCNLLVAAAAGAGKTAVLVERIIKRITNEERPVDIDKLLVVTFTNAAASEMRERIGDAISKALENNPHSKRLQNQLTLLNKASITTIHSFCLEVIKNNFHKIDLDPGFRIGDQTETTLLKLEVIEEMFEEWYEMPDREDFLSLVECYGGNRDDKDLQDMVLKLYEFAKSLPHPEKWLNEASNAFNVSEDFNFGDSDWAKVIALSVRIELLGLENSMKKAISTIKRSEGLEPYLENFENELKYISYLIGCCESSWKNLYDGFEGLEFKSLKRVGKDVNPDDKKLVTKVRDDVKGRVKKIYEDTFGLDNVDISREIAELHPLMKCLSKLVIDFDIRYSRRKREKGIIDFNDIEHFALEILTCFDEKGVITPSDVALQYREKFDEILVDEYQDSNLVQEFLLNTISKQDIPNRFMVGDVKQSIYRFRQAKPELFLEKYNTYSVNDGDLYRKINLYKNFRSRSEVIEGVNYIFKRLMSVNIGELEYTDDERLNLGSSYEQLNDGESITGGPVEVHLIEKSIDEAEEETFAEGSGEEDEQTLSLEDEEKLDNIQIEARMIALRIKELIKGEEGKKFKVHDRGINGYRPLEFRDIVILLRATSRWAPVFLEELTNAGIPTFADTGVGYFETIEIKTIISLLQIIDNPMQDIPMLAVLRSPIFSFTPEELIDIRMGDSEITYYEAIKAASKIQDDLGQRAEEVLESINRWQNKALHMSVDELLWYLYKETGYYGYVGAMTGGVQRQANLRVLFERAKQYEDTSFKGLFNFINFINKLKVSSGDMGSAKILGENENVVRIMSIHKSKGLEFPVVFVSGMGKQFNLQDLTRSILFHHSLYFGPEYVDYKRRIAYPSIIKESIKKKVKIESLSEEMRILYVAFTRAKEKLIITGSINNLEKAIQRWNFEPEGIKIPEYEVLKAKTYYDWIVPAIIHHKDCVSLKGNCDEQDRDDIETSRWEVKTWSRQDIILEERADVQEEMDVLKELEVINKDDTSSNYKDEILRRLNFKYKYEKSSGLPAKLSVTEIKRIKGLEIADEDSTPMFNVVRLKTPAFLEEKSGLTSAERGTITHLVMQRLDFSKGFGFNDIKNQMDYMVRSELLSEVQAKSVNIKRVENFFKTELGLRMINSPNVRREVPFHIELKSTEIYRDLPNDYEGELIAVQGIIDCFFEESGEIVLLDYKTDYVAADNIDEIKERYRVQIELYARAIEEITGKKVKEKFIHLFYNGQTINY